MPDLVGLVLAAGAGRRFGGPKALARTASDEPWVAIAVGLMRRAGCDEVVVVLGAEAMRARPLVPPVARVVVAERWAEGVGASLAAGLRTLPEADAALVTLVDLPGMPDTVPARLLERGAEGDRLARASYDGAPGHPVLVGRDHWTAIAETLQGDEGGRAYLELHHAEHVECGDLFSGADIDHR